MSKKLIKNGVSENKLIKNLNAEFLNGFNYDKISYTQFGFLADEHDGLLIKFDYDISRNRKIYVRLLGFVDYNPMQETVDTVFSFFNEGVKLGCYERPSCIHNGRNIGDVTVFTYDNSVYAWFPICPQHLCAYSYCIDSNSWGYKNKFGNCIATITNGNMPTENVTRKFTSRSQVAAHNNTGTTFDHIDLPGTVSALDIDTLPPVDNVGTIILRYNGVVNLNEYISSKNNWLKIYVPYNFISNYRKTYPQIADLFYSIYDFGNSYTGYIDMPSGVFIIKKRNNNAENTYTELIDLKSYDQSFNDLVQGIFVIEGNNSIVVATKDSGPCYWCTTRNIDGSGFTTLDMTRAEADLNGKLNTAFQILHEECQDPSCAVGFCANYGTEFWPAGNWWLPSLGEIKLINSHIEQVNYALSLVGGDLLNRNQWSSTEANKDHVWMSGMSPKNALSQWRDCLKIDVNNNVPASHPSARPVTKLSNIKDYCTYKSQGLPAMTMIDTTSPVLPDISNLPDIQTLDKIILRYNGVVSDLNTYLASAPITLDDLISQGFIDSDTTAQDLVDMGILDEAQLEHTDSNSKDVEIPREKFSDLQDAINEKITAQNNSIAKANQSGSLKSKGLNDTNASFEVNNFEIMPLVNLDDYIGVPNSWLKIFVPVAYIQNYRDTYPYLASHFFPIQGDINQNSEIGGTNLIKGSKTFDSRSISRIYDKEHWHLLDETYRGGNILSLSMSDELVGHYANVNFTGFFQPKTTYTFSFYARGNIDFEVFPCYLNTQAVLYDSSGRIIKNGVGTFTQLSFGITEKFKKYVICFTTQDVDTPITDKGQQTIWDRVGAQIRTRILSEGKYFEIACPKIEYGTVPTSWSPAPEDIDFEISTLNESLESTKQEFNNYISLQELKTIFPDKSEEIDLLISSKQSQEP